MSMIRDERLGPLSLLAGVWEGDKGDDRALAAKERVPRDSRYRERLTLEPFGPVDNHEQVLWGLRYATKAWRLGEPEPYHEETGYWLWDAAERQVMRCFIVPRGVTVLAGGTVAPDATTFQLAAELGSSTYGICSNHFLDREFRTVRYELAVTIHSPESWSYDEDTQLLLKGRSEILHHRDANTLTRVG